MKVRIGTRGSRLAVLQAQRVAEQIRNIESDLETELVTIGTSGDMGRKDIAGAFVKEVNGAVHRGEVDLAVHSLKDLPTGMPDSVVLAGFPERLTPNDALVSPSEEDLQDLPPNSVIGTGSRRRKLEISCLRPDLEFKEISGNVDTRIRKVEEESDYDALVTSMAALERLGLEEKATYKFDFREVVPAAGQGSLSIVMRKNDEGLSFLKYINDDGVYKESVCERAFLRELGLGCRAGAGAIGRVEGSKIKILSVLHEAGERHLEELTGDNPADLGREAGRRLKNAG